MKPTYMMMFKIFVKVKSKTENRFIIIMCMFEYIWGGNQQKYITILIVVIKWSIIFTFFYFSMYSSFLKCMHTMFLKSEKAVIWRYVYFLSTQFLFHLDNFRSSSFIETGGNMQVWKLWTDEKVLSGRSFPLWNQKSLKTWLEIETRSVPLSGWGIFKVGFLGLNHVDKTLLRRCSVIF